MTTSPPHTTTFDSVLDEHRHLRDLIRLLQLSMLHPRPNPIVIQRLLDELDAALRMHFEHEEHGGYTCTTPCPPRRGCPRSLCDCWRNTRTFSQPLWSCGVIARRRSKAVTGASLPTPMPASATDSMNTKRQRTASCRMPCSETWQRKIRPSRPATPVPLGRAALRRRPRSGEQLQLPTKSIVPPLKPPARSRPPPRRPRLAFRLPGSDTPSGTDRANGRSARSRPRGP
jgi:hypothetical protein